MSGSENPKVSFEYLASKALFDEKFAQALVENPAQALESIGIEPTEEILTALQKIDVDSIAAVAAAFQTGSSLGQP
jgi:hypothetical protein